MKARLVPLLGLAALGFFSLAACTGARLQPADEAQKVPNKPNAAAAETKLGVVFQAEASAFSADERVRDEVTALKITVVNKGEALVNVEYAAFELVADDGSKYLPVDPKTINIRGATRTIGLPADTIITRTSDSAVNAPNRSETEKQQVRGQLAEQALASGPLSPGDRTVGYVYFERVPSNKTKITLVAKVLRPESGEVATTAEIPFQVRREQE